MTCMFNQIQLYLQVYLFENLRDKCIVIYRLDPAYFLTSPGLAWQACLKKNRSRIRIIN